MAKSIVKVSKEIREQLKKRIDELGLTLTAVCEDSAKRGMLINIGSLSKYLGLSKLNNLSDDHILWLCYRYGIFVTLQVGSIVIEAGKPHFKVPEYNETTCLTLLKALFPNGKIVEKKKVVAGKSRRKVKRAIS